MFNLFQKKKKVKAVADHEDGREGIFLSQTYDSLLEQHQGLVAKIRMAVGVTEAVWKSVYLPFIKNYAEMVQQLPASEAHHHSGPGGLLLHGLEAGEYALKLRRGTVLPSWAEPDVISEQQEIWSWAIFSAAMMHDMGKPLTDLIIELDDSSLWNPLMGVIKNGRRYKVSFNPDRKYSYHESMPLLLVHSLIPEAGMLWLSEYKEALAQWSKCLSGDYSEKLGEIVKKADQFSVSKNLGGDQVQLATATQKPLHSKLAKGIRYIIEKKELPLNRKGSAGWMTEAGLWLVSKRILDTLRTHLTEAGYTGVPSSNPRLMDELSQFGYIKEFSEGAAITKATVQDGDWKGTLTFLCFEANKLWPGGENMPSMSEAVITPVKSDKTEADSSNENNAEAKTSKPSLVDGGESDGSLDLPLPPGIKLGGSKPEITVSAESKVIATSQPNSSALDKSNPGADFITWMATNLSNGKLQINSVSAPLHMVPEGLLLVSPVIFRKYCNEVGNLKETKLQKHFQKLRVNKKNKDTTNIWTYKVTGSHKKNKINGFLVPDPEAVLGIKLPEANELLEIVAQSANPENN